MGLIKNLIPDQSELSQIDCSRLARHSLQGKHKAKISPFPGLHSVEKLVTRGQRLNAASSPGRSCISFPPWGAARTVRAGTGTALGAFSPPASVRGAALRGTRTRGQGAGAARWTHRHAASWVDARHQTSGKPRAPSTASAWHEQVSDLSRAVTEPCQTPVEAGGG